MGNIIEFPGRAMAARSEAAAVDVTMTGAELRGDPETMKQYYSVSDDGRMIYTELGKDYYRNLFSFAGISIHTVETYSQHCDALDASARFSDVACVAFGEKTESLKHQWLAAIMSFDFEKADRLGQKVKMRQSLAVV